MSRDQIAADLRRAESAVAHGERLIARQKKVIAKLQAESRPTADARELLKTFEVMQRLHVADRDRLIQDLRAAE